MAAKLLIALNITAAVALNAGVPETECCQQSTLDSQIGQRYDLVRKFLIHHGYRPSARHRNVDQECLLFRDVCRRFPEVELCGAADNRPCVFDWLSEGGEPVVVDTVGENLADLTVIGLGLR